MLDFLTDNFMQALRYLNKNLLYELRIRADSPVKVNYQGEYLFLTERGVSKLSQNAMKPNREQIAVMLSNACQKSVYAVNEELKRGFVTTARGERIGVGGTFVTENGKVVSVRDITSLCIRVPHRILGCADFVLERCLKTPSSLLLMSRPGMGKTTFLREIISYLAEKYNVLVADERGELSDAGTQADVISYSDKATAFSCGIRALRPDTVVTDELEEADYAAVERMITGGVRVVASAHLTKWRDVPRKVFDRYVLLSSERIGEVESIFDAKGEKVYG